MKHDTITNAARMIGVPRTTLASAIKRGELDCVFTPGGLCLVSLADAKRWRKKTRQPGPKPKQ